jgi:hypothetical protein
MATNNMEELGNTGLRQSGGHISEEFLTKLRGAAGRKAFREMADNHPIIGGILFAFEKTVTRLDWHMEKDDAYEGEDERVEFLQGALDDMSESWTSSISGILSMMTYGWSYHELVYKYRRGPSDDPSKNSRYNDGKIGWRKWPVRSQESLLKWDIDETGGLRGMVQTTEAGAAAPIPIEKALLFRTNTARGNPEGRSLIRNAYRPHFFQKRIEEIEAVGIERDLAGLPVAFMDPAYLSTAASPAEVQVREAVSAIVKGIKRNEMEGVIFPLAYNEQGHKTMDLQLLSSGGSRQFDTDKIVARYNQQIAMSVLADFLLLGHEGVGSQALGASKIDLWMMAVEALALAIAETVNNHAIPRLLKLNGMDVEECPKLVFGQVDHIDLGVLGNFIKAMTDAGVITPDPTLEDFVRETASLPPAEEPDEDEDMGLDTGMSPEDMAAMLAAQQAPPPGKPGGPPAATEIPGGDAGAGAPPAAA